jgi:hydroxymethylbilane synthase
VPSRVRPHRRSLPLRVGTRASPLAMVHTRTFLALLSRFCPVLRGMDVFHEQAIRTSGDATQARGDRLSDVGGKGLFSKEIHEALLDGGIDFAVHSLKDLETELPSGVVLACVLPREDARDALILGPDCQPSVSKDPYAGLPQGAVVGSGSVRRQAQLLAARPDLTVVNFRGNVQSRLDKVRRGDVDASILAMAGLNRLGLTDEASVVLPESVMLPSACQGIIGVTIRASDLELLRLLAAISDPAAAVMARAERSLLAALDGSCHTPIGAHSTLLDDGRMRLEGLVARSDGRFVLRRSVECLQSDAARAGTALGAELRAHGRRDMFT